ncbi:Ubiquitin-conjugating enzyme E2 6 [Coemansia sp. RSA 1813]|nr:Ubiquitin-conjugating enzyme E2 6 [Coemansia sp. RSA 1646]KAJ1766862.1 Ubiquitin-conjugating enzyme E2 6 [Coemansia sp. RSA 1843]KAJ2093386.1 Ubiquitin-conjugating enzyme E2 6 [Coemansia sp. RSA 986]KAJ2217195.1 Ubiquitin-conjugating enzyme E2 6 [Coemansia sp. RSA 487]KAJ2572392.1 Ubiquitin-conjugating enzyme E2 6 [Coemansia sp. RSA 1813]
MASKAAFRRLNKEYLAIQKNPTPFITAKPLETNILEWHYVLNGPPDTQYEGGEYHGRLRFPSDYPYKPPAIQMITPSGRFQTNTNICMSMSNFHPDTWNPAWSVSTILNGMLSFMVEEEDTTGSIRTSMADRKVLARRSHKFNLLNSKFREIFPELCMPEAAPVATGTKKPSSSTTQNPCQQPQQQQQRLQQIQLKAKTKAEASMRQTASSAAVALADSTNHNNNQGAARVAGLAALPRKWIVLFVVVAYIFASKAISRLLTA